MVIANKHLIQFLYYGFQRFCPHIPDQTVYFFTRLCKFLPAGFALFQGHSEVLHPTFQMFIELLRFFFILEAYHEIVCVDHQSAISFQLRLYTFLDHSRMRSTRLGLYPPILII